MIDATLSPTLAVILFILACLAGYQYRRVWKEEGPRWQLWLFGGVAGILLFTVGFIPVDVAQ